MCGGVGESQLLSLLLLLLLLLLLPLPLQASSSLEYLSLRGDKGPEHSSSTMN